MFPVLFCDVGPTLGDPLRFKGSLMFASFCCHGFFERHCCFTLLNVFACFCNISFVFMHFCAFVRCVAFVVCVGTVHGAWYWRACHASHHHHMFIMFIMFIIMFIVDHHHVHCSLFVVQSLNIDC